MKKKGLFFAGLLILIAFCVQGVNAEEGAVVPTPAPKVVHAQPASNPTPSSSSQGEYVGADKCAGCHPTEYKDFSKRKFLKSWKILKMRGEEGNPDCLACHSTGYGNGGFKSEEKTPHLVGKQCEACHGPGGNHVSNPGDAGFRNQLKVINKKNVCIECHACMTTHRSADF